MFAGSAYYETVAGMDFWSGRLQWGAFSNFCKEHTETDKNENLNPPSFYLAPFWAKVMVFLKSNLTLFPVQYSSNKAMMQSVYYRFY